jgi:hypothetical protein
MDKEVFFFYDSDMDFVSYCKLSDVLPGLGYVVSLIKKHQCPG